MSHLPVYRRTIARLLLMLFSLMLVNSVVFRHAHRLANGQIIAHAHPYKPFGDGPYQPNTHTANELFWLDTVSNALFDLSAPLVFLAALAVAVPSGRRPLPVSAVTLPAFACFLHRGPPATV